MQFQACSAPRIKLLLLGYRETPVAEKAPCGVLPVLGFMLQGGARNSNSKRSPATITTAPGRCGTMLFVVSLRHLKWTLNTKNPERLQTLAPSTQAPRPPTLALFTFQSQRINLSLDLFAPASVCFLAVCPSLRLITAQLASCLSGMKKTMQQHLCIIRDYRGMV